MSVTTVSQFLSQIPRQLLQQQQRLTPRLIQAMDILQLNMLALESRVTQELDANPALEIAPGEDELVEAPAEVAVVERSNGERPLVVEDGNARQFERLDNLVREYDWIDDAADYRGSTSYARRVEDSDNKLDAMANAPARPGSLYDHLMRQWRMVEVDERTRALGTAILEELDSAGRLPTPLSEIGLDLQPPPTPHELERTLAAVQQLDPRGVAARSLQECLLLQLAALPGDNTLERRLIAEQFENLQKNRLPAIAKALNVSVTEVNSALEAIGELSLHPGWDVVNERPPSVVPDVIVELDESTGRYDVRLARGNMRELRISPEFRELLERARSDKTTRDFVRQKIEAANEIIDAVRYRRERLLDVARAVVEAQREFLVHGEQHLRILRMSDLAERFHCDPSTISRTVDEKYIQTPQGIYPLRRFFTGGAETEAGDALGWPSIKAKVQQIVADEDRRNPLSDDEIVERLKTAGIEIKRRTVAKYRAQLAILPARQRRQY
jgi:RNA polymerase sigma-54 factor